MDFSHNSHLTGQLCEHIKAGLIRSLCADGLLTPSQRDELLRRLRMAGRC